MMRVAAIYGLLPAGETIVTYTTACRVYVEDTLLHRVSRLIFVRLPAGVKGDEPKERRGKSKIRTKVRKRGRGEKGKRI